MDDAALGGKVVAALQALVAQQRGGAIGGRRYRAGAGLAAIDLDVKMIDRHRDQISSTAELTSERSIGASLEILGYTVSNRPGDLTALSLGLNYHPLINIGERDAQAARDFDGELKAIQDNAVNSRAAKCSSSANW